MLIVTILKIAHPLVPFITQTCYEELNKDKSIMNYKCVLEKKEETFEECVKISKLLRSLKLHTSIQDFYINKNSKLINHYTKIKINEEQEIKLTIYNHEIHILKSISNEFVEFLLQKKHL